VNLRSESEALKADIHQLSPKQYSFENDAQGFQIAFSGAKSIALPLGPLFLPPRKPFLQPLLGFITKEPAETMMEPCEDFSLLLVVAAIPLGALRELRGRLREHECAKEPPPAQQGEQDISTKPSDQKTDGHCPQHENVHSGAIRLFAQLDAREKKRPRPEHSEPVEQTALKVAATNEG
jgi:hypothetical protein